MSVSTNRNAGEGPRRRKLIVADAMFIGNLGHPLNYSRAVLEAAAEAGLAPVLLGNVRLPRSAIRAPAKLIRCFSRNSGDAWVPGYAPGFGLHELIRPIRAALRLPRRLARFRRAVERVVIEPGMECIFSAELRGGLRRAGACARDVVFMHTLDLIQARGWARALARIPIAELPSIVLLFRDRCFEGPPTPEKRDLPAAREFAEAVGRLENASRRGRPLAFVTDSERLVEQFALLSSARFGVVPIPARPVTNARCGRLERTLPSRLRAVYLGMPITAKGFHIVGETIRAMPAELRERFEFVLQSTTCERLCARYEGWPRLKRFFDENSDPHIRLIPEAMTQRQYDDLLASADVVFALHDAEQYYANTSGVLTEALCAGKIVIAVRNGWVGNRLEWLGSGGVVLDERTPEALMGALRMIADDPDHHRPSAEAVARWSGYHSPNTLVNEIVSLADALNGAGETVLDDRLPRMPT